jgi:hypothetical protein
MKNNGDKDRLSIGNPRTGKKMVDSMAHTDAIMQALRR